MGFIAMMFLSWIPNNRPILAGIAAGIVAGDGLAEELWRELGWPPGRVLIAGAAAHEGVCFAREGWPVGAG